jgi:SOS response regulatory protein OraA/RecX
VARTAKADALRLLSRARLTEAQLWRKLEPRGHSAEAIAEAVEYCKRERYLDDRIFAELYVETLSKPLGNARLIAQLVAKGIDRDAAADAVGRAPRSEEERLSAAFARVVRRTGESAPRSGIPSYPSAARALERLGFPAPLIYRCLRRYAAAETGALAALAERE